MTLEVGAGAPVIAICGGSPDTCVRIVQSLPARGACVALSHHAVALTKALRERTDRVIEARSELSDLLANRIYVVPLEQNARGRLDGMLRALAGRADDCIAVAVDLPTSDGLLGLQRIRETNGFVIACTSTLETASDLVLSVDELVARLPALVDSRFAAARPDAEAAGDEDDSEGLRDVLTMLRVRTGHDFTAYKRATIRRRIARRMHVCQVATVADYHRFLRERPAELSHLLRDVLISVTSFFRDRDAFDTLAAKVIPRLFANKGRADQLRVWVAGCATGEEAYSIAILLLEHATQLKDPPELQIFATDIDEAALLIARTGMYSTAIETDVSPERLARFFTRENDQYRVVQDLREMMLFSPHNLLRDPPFSRVELISSRNVLIYLNREAQERALATFHFALKTQGVLFLGSSESAESTQQFSAIHAKARLFERRLGVGTASITDGQSSSGRWRPFNRAHTTEDRPLLSFGEMHHRIVEQYAPPSVLVNEDLDIVHISENAGRFFTVQGGEPSRRILRLVHPSLRFELRGAIYAARQPEHGHDTRVVRFEEGGQTRVVELRVRVVDLPALPPGTMLVMFDELNVQALNIVASHDSHHEPVVREMEDELHRTRDQLRTTVEQYETSLEELKASNEELYAINDELRSATEELETSKQELQSVNEELSTLNFELKDKIEEVSRVNSDLQNLMSSTDIGVLFLDRTLHVKRFTPRIKKLFNIIPSDIGRPLQHVTHVLDCDELIELAQRVLVDLRSIERELSTKQGKRYLTRLLPYRSLDDRIEGVVVTFVEITQLKHAEEARDRSEAALRTVEQRLVLALRGAPIAVLAQDDTLRTTWAWLHGRELDATERDSLALFTPPVAERFREIALQVLAQRTAQRVELDVRIQGAERCYEFLVEPGGTATEHDALTAVGYDVTPDKVALRTLRETDKRKDEFLATLSHELRNPLTPLRTALEVVQIESATAEHRAHAYTVMDRELNTLVRLVDELLDLSRITHGKVTLDLQAVDLVRVIESAIDTTRSSIESARHTVDVQLPPVPLVVNGDAGRLAQVVTNLLVNAVKYTPDGGHIEVVLERVGLERARLAIRDTGIGIDSELLPRIFEIFVQSRDERSRSKGGLGIGLNLVAKLVELHDGTVKAESAGLGNGAQFTIELPLRKAPHAHSDR